ncbi:ABC transporter substrate-binding protein [Mycobacterium parmense]|uniref:ABC transporter substrate-binding protein n=1 Tax=Mycobacterium parmense TaxID=185642 RepID=A0A7I7YZ32_9MYCO|nr:ABC transporter substrate-binding protein [Mycobacterium parmense]ORW59201.1 ABC transporter substrate-binding protein [Mycobacterium parmense]BBZ46567.1 ABC transporter substrate-binding protein [Mycobacterium parmense]
MRGSILAVVAAVCASLLSGCGVLGEPSVVVNVGYQSKTINTVNAGTLMRDRGEFEKALARVAAAHGVKYRVVWQDFASGAPLTAQMMASHVDIGSMGDYPLLVNGSKTRRYSDAQTSFIAVTGYNLRGSLNQVIVPTGSTVTSLADLVGRRVSTSLGSAGDGMLAAALQRARIDPGQVHLVNQDPAVGASAIEGKQVDAMAQFVPWPQLLVFRKQGELLYDGGDNDVPTFHGVVARDDFTHRHPEVITAFLQAMSATTDYIVAHPLQAALRVSALTRIEPEVVYLYNGPNGLVSFDMTIKTQLVAALGKIKPFLVRKRSVSPGFDISAFVDESYLQAEIGPDYQRRRADTVNPDRLTGFDDRCGLPVDDPAQASELWPAGATHTEVAATPTCLLRRIAATQSVRAAYVPDTVTGTRLFADHAVWLVDTSAPTTQRYKPFDTPGAAAAYRAQHPQTVPVTYRTALSQSRSPS